jgi:cell division transport system permease protein
VEAKLLQLEERFALSVVLADDLPTGAEEELARQLERLPAVAAVTFQSKAEALSALEKELETEMGTELAANPLPASFRLRLKLETLASGRLAELVTAVRSFSGVREVIYPETWAEQYGRLAAVLRSGRLALLGIFIAVAGLLVAAAVRQLFCGRKEDVLTLKFLGAPWSFTLAPYLVAGGVIGLGGGLVGLLAAVGLATGFSRMAGIRFGSLLPGGYLFVGAAVLLSMLLIGTAPLTFRRHSPP